MQEKILDHDHHSSIFSCLPRMDFFISIKAMSMLAKTAAMSHSVGVIVEDRVAPALQSHRVGE